MMSLAGEENAGNTEVLKRYGVWATTVVWVEGGPDCSCVEAAPTLAMMPF
jgi:hypothetical protein